MKTWIRYLWIAALAQLASARAEGEPLSRTSALLRALEQNPKIAESRAEIAEAKAKKDQAHAARMPDLSLEAGVAPGLRAKLVPGTAVESTKSWTDVSIDDLSIVVGGRASVVQPLYTFGKIGHRADAAEHGVRAKEAETEMTAADVALDVARLYEQHLFASDAEMFFQEIVFTIGRSIEDTRERLRAPKSDDVSESDLLRFETAHSAALVAQHQAAWNAATTLEGIRAYLAIPRGTRVEIAEPHLEPIGPVTTSTETLIASALESRPELRALDEGIRAYDDLASAERAAYLPDFFVLAFLGGAYTPGRDLVRTRYVTDPLLNFSPGIILGARWAFQVLMPGARADEMVEKAVQLEATKRWALLGIPAETKKAINDAFRAAEDIQETARGVEHAKRWMVIAFADYDAGLSDSRNAVDAVQAYADLKTAYLDSILRLNVARAELAKATGVLARGESSLYPGSKREAGAP
jgi:outer membrane protein TolC